MAVMAVIEPPGELMYIITSRLGSCDSSTSNWAMMSSADVSSTCTPMKMMRSSNSLVYGSCVFMPYGVFSENCGST